MEERKSNNSQEITDPKEHSGIDQSNEQVFQDDHPQTGVKKKGSSSKILNSKGAKSNGEDEKGSEWIENPHEVLDKDLNGSQEGTERRSSSKSSKRDSAHRVHPEKGLKEYALSDTLKVDKYFITIPREELEERGIHGFRLKLTSFAKDMGLGLVFVGFVLVYTLLVAGLLAFEHQIYDSKAAIVVFESIELLLMAVFIVEIAIYNLGFGPILYYNYQLNIVDSLLIALVVVWTTLDLIDSDIFRVKGAFRVVRVALLYSRVSFSVRMVKGRILSNNVYYSSKQPIEQVCNILKHTRDKICSVKVAADLNYCIDMITSGKLFGTLKNQHENEDQQESGLGWARINANANLKRLDSEEIRAQIRKSVKKHNIERKLNSQAKAILEEVQEFEFDIFALSKATNGNEMVTCATYLLNKHDLFVKLAIDNKTFDRFIKSIQDGYNDVAYHNKIHGMDVGRLAYYYATSCEMMEKASLTDLDLCALIVGGAIHDFDHLGWNNAYLIETQHEWAITYNDISVCENHHVASAFNVIKSQPGCNIFDNMSLEEFKNIRNKITKMVIATDMALHFDYINKFKAFVENNDGEVTKEEEKTFLMCMCLHIADITNPTKRWIESYKWTCLVYEEFFVQGDKEKELGLPVGNMNDRCNINLAKSQMGFIDFIVQPSFEVYVTYLPKVQIHIDQIKQNRKRWESMVGECKNLQEEGNDLIKRFHQIEASEHEETKTSSKHDSRKKASELVNPLEDNLGSILATQPKEQDKNMEVLRNRKTTSVKASVQ